MLWSISQSANSLQSALKQLPTTLNLLGFAVSHYSDFQNWELPWVEIRGQAPENWRSDLVQQNAWRAANLFMRKKMIELLQQYYHNRLVPTDYILTTKRIGYFEGFVLCNNIFDDYGFANDGQITSEKVECYKEFTDFWNFLRDQ